ncbi:uncharacterized protein MELLADRAFT_104146 [Melampsora larici-populina 98AG31]|uniref:F-box domain-containing protein n=1 Tax=Melampsora larici-populina (strain 98AG31 / pathotype 3-4-7) TaxID=747676 RepID=F4RDQ7_MELLP|nr:uncharacterized protein MELLADRAFT_104146 [Melampsora larici-populina 98AG31]EGG09441.1 hypothetical protein MELLADRAFT_104146 [Melampsora larici-populina 98AG31]
MLEVQSRIQSQPFNKVIKDQASKEEDPKTLTFKTNLTNQNTKGILNLPTELITLIGIHLCLNSSRTKSLKDKTHHHHHQRQRMNLDHLEFDNLVNFGKTCKTLHLICERIYQKQFIINLPIKNRHHLKNYFISSRSFYTRNGLRRRDCREEEEKLILQTIDQLDKLSNQWKGIENVNWVYITNQSYQRLKESNHFLNLMFSTTKLIKSFNNLRYLCLDKINDEMILNLLEEGINENLESLTINLPQTDHQYTKDGSIQNLDQRIKKINVLKSLKALQINEIQPNWIDLINQTHQLHSLSLHISEFSSLIISELDPKSSIKNLEILGGLRSPESSKRLLMAIGEKFSRIEVFRFGMHFRDQYDENEKILKVDSSNLISKLTELKQFIFNHADAPIPLNFSNPGLNDQDENEQNKFQRCFDYSKPYFEKSKQLEELISFDFSDRLTNTGIMAKRRTHSSEVHHRFKLQKNLGWESRLEDEGKKWNSKTMGYNSEDGSSDAIPISMYEINNIKESILLPFQSRWTRLGD